MNEENRKAGQEKAASKLLTSTFPLFIFLIQNRFAFLNPRFMRVDLRL